MSFKLRASVLVPLIAVIGLSACAEVSVPDARNVKIPSPISAEERKEAVNERPDSVMYLPLGADVLVPERIAGDQLPNEIVGPFELRSETLAGALQLILADYDVSISFETEQGLTRKVTVANLKGELDKVVNRVCSLADLYCSYEEGGIIVKDRQTFAVTLPPLANAEGGDAYIADVIQGLGAVLGSGSTPVSDPTTRTVIYSATQRTSQLAENYFQRLRANTAMIVFETYIWEVSLSSGNTAGIDWSKIESFGKFKASIAFNGTTAADFTNPVSIGLPTTQTGSPTEFIQFLSQFGAVKTISQPQITVLSGSDAELRVADTENYVSEVSSTISGDNTTTSVSTDSVDSGFTLTIGSSWDKSTVYANVNINLTNVDSIEDFAFDTDSGGGQTTIQLPQTTERELTTQIRVRPGDSVLIAGLVREVDNFSSRGPGFMEPIVPDSRTAETDNLELVILLRPRVIVYTASDDPRYKKFIDDKNTVSLASRAREEWLKTNADEKAVATVKAIESSPPPPPAAIVEIDEVQEAAPLAPVSAPILPPALPPAPASVAPPVARPVVSAPVKATIIETPKPVLEEIVLEVVDEREVVAPTPKIVPVSVGTSSRFIPSDSDYSSQSRYKAPSQNSYVSRPVAPSSLASPSVVVPDAVETQVSPPPSAELQRVIEDDAAGIYTVEDIYNQSPAPSIYNKGSAFESEKVFVE